MKRCVRAAEEVEDYGDMKGLADQDSEESDVVNEPDGVREPDTTVIRLGW